MRPSNFITLSISFLLAGYSNGQKDSVPAAATKQHRSMDQFEYTYENAHPRAQALMKDEFYWSPIEESAPFGSDDGSDAAYGFLEWRSDNKKASPVVYLDELIEGWQYPFFDYREMDTTKIRAYIFPPDPDEKTIQEKIKIAREAFENSPDTAGRKLSDKELRDMVMYTSRQMGIAYLVGLDNAIIAIGFAQFVLEGKIDNDMRALAITAINRQLLPMLINRYDQEYREVRKHQLTKMLEIIHKANP